MGLSVATKFTKELQWTVHKPAAKKLRSVKVYFRVQREFDKHVAYIVIDMLMIYRVL